MPRHQGRGNGHKQRRQRSGKTFLQPCLLLCLSDEDQHGYDLYNSLEKIIPDIEEYDSTIIYRLLREMEADGFIASYEGEVSRGPRRRIYKITNTGKQQLSEWTEQLKHRREEIDSFLNLFQQYSR